MKLFLTLTLLLTSLFAVPTLNTSDVLQTQVKEKKRSSLKKFVRYFDVSRHGKKMYTKVKYKIKKLKAKVLKEDKKVLVSKDSKKPKLQEIKRKESVIRQFIAKADILENARVKREIINVEDDIISFLNSFKHKSKSPINIE